MFTEQELSKIEQEEIAAIEAERDNQVSHGYTYEHDDEHVNEELLTAAIAYLAGKVNVIDLDMSDKSGISAKMELNFQPWPELDNEKIASTSRKRQLRIAAAFILAELERIRRKEIIESKLEKSWDNRQPDLTT